MASSSAKALSAEPTTPRECRLPRFNGLLIGQGTVGVTKIFKAMQTKTRFNGLLIGQGTVGVTSANGWYSEYSFQWPPHRPRHCRWPPGQLRYPLSRRFNGLLIGQGTVGRTRGSRMSFDYAFQWPPHRPRHCRSSLRQVRERVRYGFNGLLIGQGTVGKDLQRDVSAIPVSMASSSAKALSVVPQPVIKPAPQSFNGLLIGQGTVGRLHDSIWTRCTFQWPPHRPRHCRLIGRPTFVVKIRFQWPPHRPRHCRQWKK